MAVNKHPGLERMLIPYDMPQYHPHPTHPHWRKLDGGFLDRLVITINGKPVEAFSWDQYNRFVRVRVKAEDTGHIIHRRGVRLDLYGGTKYVTRRLKGIVGVFKETG